MPSNEKLWADLDQLAQFHLPIKITEFDDKTADPQLQAANLRRFFKVCFAHPGVTAILQWGFWEGRHWRPEAALWRKDWTIKPNGQAYVKLVDDEWKTRGDGTSDDGTLRFRGFFGDYTISIGRPNMDGELTRHAARACCSVTAVQACGLFFSHAVRDTLPPSTFVPIGEPSGRLLSAVEPGAENQTFDPGTACWGT